jgi:hypothetical protein
MPPKKGYRKLKAGTPPPPQGQGVTGQEEEPAGQGATGQEEPLVGPEETQAGEKKAFLITNGPNGSTCVNEVQAGGKKRKPKGAKKGGCGPMPTEQRVMVGGRSAVVYKGSRGGQYVKKGGEYVPLSKVK